MNHYIRQLIFCMLFMFFIDEFGTVTDILSNPSLVLHGGQVISHFLLFTIMGGFMLWVGFKTFSEYLKWKP